MRKNEAQKTTRKNKIKRKRQSKWKRIGKQRQKRKSDNQTGAAFLLTTVPFPCALSFPFPDRFKQADRETQPKQNHESEFRNSIAVMENASEK